MKSLVRKKSDIVAIKSTDKPDILDDQLVRVSEQGNITELFYSVRKSKGGYIVKVNNDYYIDTRTDEIKEFKHIENRSQDLQNVAKSLKSLRDIINTNIVNTSFCVWSTFTYAENMRDSHKLQYDFKNCVTRLRAEYGHFEYIVCAEPQGRGAWHLHCLFIFPGKAPFMKNSVVANCWKKGFVNVQSLDNVDNVGAYLTAYLGDIELKSDEKCSIPKNMIKTVDYVDDKTGQKLQKKYIKGGRLHLYPPGFNIYRTSKGIKRPLVYDMEYKKAKEKVSSAKLTYQKSVSVSTADFKNVLHYEYYNSIRSKECQDTD